MSPAARTVIRLLLACWLACACATGMAAERRVLVLYSLGADASSEWQRLVHRGLYAELARHNTYGTPAIFEERFDANRIGDDKAQEGMAPYLLAKYAGMRFDAIITENFVAAQFLDRHPELFPGVPRHFVNHGRMDWMPALGTGYEVSSDFRRVVGIVPVVAPAVRRIVVIGDRTQRGEQWLQRVREVAPQYPAIRFEYWIDDTVQQLRERVRHLEFGSAILMLVARRDEGGQRIQPRELTQQVAEAASVPVFAHSDSVLGSGVVGGYLLSGEAVGNILGRLVLGKPAQLETLQGYAFDYLAARKAGLRNLPPEARIVNRPDSIWELYRWQIAAGLALIALQALLITALVLSLRSRRHAMNELAQERNSLEDRILQRTLELLQANRKLEELATTDPLTGIANRRRMNEQIAQELERARRLHHPLSLLMVDIDHFKRINDTYGHDVGDRAIVATAKLLNTNLRSIDMLARFGGEEFVLLMPETQAPVALHVAERLRAQAARLQVPADGGVTVELTISIGVAAADPHGIPDSPSSLLVRADKALYRAKREGRNLVVMG